MFSSTDQSLRIALGVIAGLLGTSVLVLLGVFCWLRQRQKRRRRKAEKSLSPSSSSTTSSLYISPIQQQQQQPASQRKFSPINTIYQLPIDNNNNNPRFSRTDSFRQAVLSGRQRTNHMTEYVSTKRDSLSYPKDDLESRSYSTLEFTIPSHTINNQNIYQTIIPASPPPILTHSV
jgi:hypothetical protein